MSSSLLCPLSIISLAFSLIAPITGSVDSISFSNWMLWCKQRGGEIECVRERDSEWDKERVREKKKEKNSERDREEGDIEEEIYRQRKRVCEREGEVIVREEES